LGAAVLVLLPQVSAEGRTAMVPHLGRRRERDVTAPVLELPAHVDVVARGGEDLVEAAHRLERVTPNRQVAAGHVLRAVIGEQYVYRAAGAGGHDPFRESGPGGGEIGPADRSEERRVGKECRNRWWRKHLKKKIRNLDMIRLLSIR